MACGTIKKQRVGVEIFDVGLEGDAPKAWFGGISNV